MQCIQVAAVVLSPSINYAAETKWDEHRVPLAALPSSSKTHPLSPGETGATAARRRRCQSETAKIQLRCVLFF